MSSTAMCITFTTTPDGADEFAAILQHALPLVQAETGTTGWIAGRAADDPTSFYLVDLFASAEALQAHMDGPAAAMILGQGGRLLAGAPTVASLEVLAVKVAN